MNLEGNILIRQDGVRLLLSPYRQSLVGGKGAAKRVQAQIQALAKETQLTFGTVRTLTDGSAEALLGKEIDCYPLGELVFEHLGGHERLFYAEEIAPSKFVVLAAVDRRVVLDEIADGDAALLNHFEMVVSQFAGLPFTLAANRALLDALPSHDNALAQLVEVSAIESAPIIGSLKFRAVGSLAKKTAPKGLKLKFGIAAAVLLVGYGGHLYLESAREGELAEEMALLQQMKNRAIDPLADYKHAMGQMSADTFISQLDVLIHLTSKGQGWIPERLSYTAGEPLKIGFESFGGTRTQLVQSVQVRNAVYAQQADGTTLLVDVSKLPGREKVPELQPLSKSLFETLDALDANSMGVVKTQVGEISTFGQWSAQKVQITVADAPLPLIKLLSSALVGRPCNVTQVELSLKGQALSGVIHLDVFGS